MFKKIYLFIELFFVKCMLKVSNFILRRACILRNLDPDMSPTERLALQMQGLFGTEMCPSSYDDEFDIKKFQKKHDLSKFNSSKVITNEFVIEEVNALRSSYENRFMAAKTQKQLVEIRKDLLGKSGEIDALFKHARLIKDDDFLKQIEFRKQIRDEINELSHEIDVKFISYLDKILDKTDIDDKTDESEQSISGTLYGIPEIELNLKTDPCSEYSRS